MNTNDATSCPEMGLLIDEKAHLARYEFQLKIVLRARCSMCQEVPVDHELMSLAHQYTQLFDALPYHWYRNECFYE
jgi:hypothetical protein